MSNAMPGASRVGSVEDYETWASDVRAAWSPDVRQAYAAALTRPIDLGGQIREFRGVFDLTQQDVAGITGEDQGDVSRLERGELNPSMERANRMLARMNDYAETKAAEDEPPPLSDEPFTDAFEVAKYLCAVRDEDDSEFTELKLQKLLYYAQGQSLAQYRRPLFGEQISRWDHGPVVEQVWRSLREFSGVLPRPDDDYDPLDAPPQVRAIAERAYSDFGQYAAWKLRNMTHEERPWAETAPNDEIRHELMADFFRERVSS